MKGMFASGTRSNMGRYTYIRREHLSIIPFVIIVGKVKITVIKHTVGDEKIVGFVSGKVYSL
jgi:hypothetical protein